MNKTIIYKKIFYGICILFTLNSCESFVEVEVPNDRITGVTVFGNNQTALNALNGLYSQLFNTTFAAGGNRSVSYLSGLSGDNFELTSTTSEMREFLTHEISPENTYNLALWTGAYETIYMANALLKGVETSNGLNEETINRITGEAKFVRAFTYFYLVQLYHNIPLILSTYYDENSTFANASPELINNQIIEDLNDANSLLGTAYPDNERIYANSYVVKALLARVHLFQENWEEAVSYSTQVISANDTYELLDNPNEVFLANSREAIWQISPAGWGGSFRHTREGNLFVRISLNSSPVQLSESFMSIWNQEDLRLQNWVGVYSDDTDLYYFPYKYKVQYDNSAGNITEYSMVMRLAKQYLIRAEANTKLGKLSEAVTDLDLIRERANIASVNDNLPNISEDDLIDIILLERRKEFFSEWGCRWLSLKRTDLAMEVLENDPQWESTDVFYPIPDQERMKNPNLEQNEGY